MSAAVEQIGRAIAEGRQSRENLAGQLAREFRNDPARFDPRRLERLGGTGLRRFLGEIGSGNPPRGAGEPRRPTGSGQRRKDHAVHGSQTGWRHLRRPEWPVWVSGVAAGIRAGGVAIVAGLMLLAVAERAVPIVRTML